MNLKELKEHVDSAVERAIEYGEQPEDVVVSLQIDDEADPHHGSVCADEDVELTYDGNAMASGCVLSGWRESANNSLSGPATASGVGYAGGVGSATRSISDASESAAKD